jgi:hypothetical protein
VWLKNPIKASDLPKRQAMANCYAALEPSERLWVKYVEEIKKLLNGNRITADDYYLLRVSLDAKKALMDLTLGEDVDLTEKTVEQILESVKSKILEKAEQRLQVEVEEHGKTKQELIAKELKDNSRRCSIAIWAGKIARVVATVIFVISFMLLSLAAFLSFPRPTTNLADNWWRYLICCLSVIFMICSIANLTWGVTLKSTKRKVEVWVRDILIRHWHRFLDL